MIMIEWISEQWGNVLFNSITPGLIGKVLFADVQQSEFIKFGLRKKDAILINVFSARHIEYNL